MNTPMAWHNRLASLLGVAMWCATSVATAQSTSVVLQPSLDTTLFNEDGGLSNGADASAFLGTTANGALRRALLEFDFSTVPADSIVTAATLTIQVDRAVGDTVQVGLHRVLSPWGEGASNSGGGGGGAQALPGDATWTLRFFPDTAQSWVTPGGDFVSAASAFTSIGAPDTYSWMATATMLADIQGWLNTPASNHGWMVVGREGGARSAKRFYTREALDLSQRPVLTLHVSPVPEPAAFLTMALGMVGLLCWMRARK